MLALMLLTALSAPDGKVPDVHLFQPVQDWRPEQGPHPALERMDLDTPGLEDVRALVEAERYDEALRAWRDAVIERLRGIELHQFGWHDLWHGPENVARAEYLAGRLDPDAYAKANARFVDIPGVAGPPGETPPPDWMRRLTDPELFETVDRHAANYANFMFATSLVARYWRTGDPVYRDKWFELTSDFARRHKRLWEEVERNAFVDEPEAWNTRANPALQNGWRAEMWVKSLACFAKALPEGNRDASWEEVLAPVNEPLDPAATEAIPAAQLADIAVSLAYDHPPDLIRRYREAGAVPNQRLLGLTALALISRAFPEFQTSTAVSLVAREGLSDYITGTMLKDGGGLEQSFNYNRGVMRHLQTVIDAYTGNGQAPRWVEQLDKAYRYRARMLGGVVMPMGGMPALGKASHEQTPPYWLAPGTLETHLANMLATIESEDPMVRRVYHALFDPDTTAEPAFTSVAYPYAGYYVQRSGWNHDSLYLFMVASRLGRGHKRENINSIEVVAYGRPLLVSAGSPAYFVPHLPEDQRDEYEQFRDYFHATSRFGSNTVSVDEKSQRRHELKANLQAYPEPIDARWYTGPDIEFAEGFYDDGWGVEEVVEGRHTRRVFYVKDPGFWILVDELHADGSHEFTQHWGFPSPRTPNDEPYVGFTREELHADPESRSVVTTAEDGPNVGLYHFGQEMAYAAHYGAKDPHRGWYSLGVTARKMPAIDLMARWRGEGRTTLVTAIVPAREGAPAITFEDRSREGVRGFNATAPGGRSVTFLTADAPAALTAGAVTVKADTLLVIEHGETVSGLTLGAKTLEAGQPLTGVSGDAAFRIAGGEATHERIRVPEMFAWQDTGDGARPVYWRDDATGEN